MHFMAVLLRGIKNFIKKKNQKQSYAAGNTNKTLPLPFLSMFTDKFRIYLKSPALLSSPPKYTKLSHLLCRCFLTSPYGGGLPCLHPGQYKASTELPTSVHQCPTYLKEMLLLQRYMSQSSLQDVAIPAAQHQILSIMVQTTLEAAAFGRVK